MADKFPADRFDDITPGSTRVGAHRVAARKFRRTKYVLWTVLAVVLLSGLGIGTVVVIDNGVFSSADDTGSNVMPTPTPTVDPSVPVTVLNGTPTADLDSSAAEVLRTAGFTVESSTNADKTDIAESVVYYSAPEYEAVARGVAQALGISQVEQSTTFSAIGSNLTVVLGSDYAPAPAG